MAIASFAIQSASSVMQYQAQSAEAEQQNALYEQNRRNSIVAASDQYAAKQTELINQRSAASQQLQETQIEGLKARSSATVAAGEAGVSGLSVDGLIGDYFAQQGRNERTIGRNYQMQADSVTSEMDGIEAQTQSRINSVQRARKPSFAAAAIGIAGAAVGSGDQYMRNTKGYGSGAS